MSIEAKNQNENLIATYSPEDNKLRLYSMDRLPRETYDLLRSSGFRWAPKQKLFVAPRWTPARENLLVRLCGEIEDEETTLAERAKQREERFLVYKEKRKSDSEQAYNSVKEIKDLIPFGQPILTGHHSQKRAERDQRRIEEGMQKSIKMWEASEYWEQKAQDVIGHTQYKDRPDVRFRRIKKLEAEKRKYERTIKKSKTLIEFWTNPEKELTWERARYIANYHDHISACFHLDKYPRGPEKSQYEGLMDLWSALQFITPKQAKDLALVSHERTIKHYSKWLKHTELRLMYEKTILDAQGYKMPEKKRPKLPSIVNFRMENAKHITKAEYAKIYKNWRGCRTSSCGTYRYRLALFPKSSRMFVPVFLVDQKVVEPPKKEAVA